MNRTDNQQDAGVTLVEILVSIVLMGLVITATLTALTVTIKASATDRDHANGHAWLQTAGDVLYARPVRPCDPLVASATDIANIITDYEATIQQTQNPESWSSGNLSIFDLRFWHVNMDPTTKLTEEGWGDLCDSADTNLQRIGIEVRSEDGRIVEQVEVIIGE
jgi:type II secretory pathway pseudopilin PulG